ncbi:MAG TPA: AAA family ATPase, partial [Polyangiaceae bacterium]|nr:AAA family ATPase [Polyangiaceae bacterium]
TIFKLTDFGIAQAARDDGTSTDMPWAVSGTPPFMAPEQFGGDWRDQGPCTDLYAFGCLAFALVTGTLPFPTTDLPTLARSHAKQELPTLVPRYPVPHGFEGWLHVLLAKRVGDRFQCAADARYALEQLDDRAVERSSAPGPPLKLLADTTPLELAPQLAVTPERAWLSKSSPTLIRRQPPPLPPDWRTIAESRDAPLVGVGAGIFGLRSFPLVDRDDERNALWSVLRLVHSDRRPRAVLLRGSAGSGKSSVARWIAERAAEVGGANVMRASHSVQQGTHDGALAMLARYLRCDGLDRDDTRTRLKDTLNELGEQNSYILDALTDLFVAPDDEAMRLLDNPAAQAEAKSRLLLHCMRLIAAERPLILVLDDVHWGLDALRLTSLLLRERQSHTPILALLTAREEVLRTRALESQELDALLHMQGSLELGIAELSHADQHSLVEQLLGLSGELVERVATRTGGNPLFAIQLVGDWIARGLLVASERGLELRSGSGEDLPDDIHALCATRIEQALGTRSDDDRQALELAALLGGEVQEAEWTRACVILGVLPSGDLPHVLARLGLLERGLGSWRFAHGVLRESLQRTARMQGRWPAQHRAIAEVLLDRYRTAASSELAARIGRHLAETHALDDAHRWLLSAARMLRVENDLERAEALLAERVTVLNRLHAPALDERRAKGELLAALIDVDRNDLDSAEQRCRRVLAHARTHGWPLIEAQASMRLGGVMLRREEYETALQALEVALATLTEAGDRQGEFEARQGIAEVRYYQSSLDAAQAAYRDNLAMAQELGDAVAMAESHWGMGYVAMWQSRLDDAQRHFEMMRELLASRGAAYRLVECMNALGEVSRLSQQYRAAERYYREALKLAHARGGDDMSIRINLALVQLFSG